jgi:hypothetical protein
VPSTNLRAALSAAVDALGDVMLEMQRRSLLARPGNTAREIEILSKRALTDEELGERTAAFEAGTTILAAAGHPDACVITCAPGDEDLP